jgi:short-subunit dehydrogenase
MPEHQFTGKRAIVTGASGGIGSCIVRELTAAGVSVGLVARQRGPLEDLRKACEGEPGATLVAPADVSDRDALRGAVRAVRDAWGAIDIAIASAGTYLRGPALESDPERHLDQWRTSYLGVLHLFQAVVPGMIERKWGRLGVVSSVDALSGVPLESAYAAGKAAEAALAGILRQELHGTGICLTTVYPSRTDTAMTASLEVPAVSRKIDPDRVARVLIRGMLKQRARSIVPAVGPRLLIGADIVSARLKDLLARRFRLSGWLKEE